MPAPSDITALILAGGFGTRVKDLLGDLPKPMAPVNGKPFVEWIVRWLKAQGVRDVVISTGYGSEYVVNHFSTQPVPEMNVQCVAELKPMGTGGGLAFAAAECGASPEAWLVANGDSLIFANVAAVCNDLGEADGVMITRAVPDTARYGSVHTDASDRITAFEEKQPGAGHINGGIYLLRHSVLESFPETRPLSLEREVFPNLLNKKNGLRAHPVEAAFLDIGTPKTLPQAEAFVTENQAQFA
ncbi:MAG: nucleotidyltransferase family protein [Verrucomicrobiota bacterium]|nr:nucleotidyltransferase family protein [Verrucomicrobiota bacterium]